MKLAKALGSVGGLTLASRILALVRDSLAARYVGAGFASDAFNGVAFRLPNMFRALFAEGAFSAAFIPMFNRKAAGPGGIAAGYHFAERALAVLLPVLILFTVVLIAAAWPITWLLSGGFSRQNPTPEQFAFAVLLSRITLPYLALISLASLLGGILNSLDKFWVNAAAPILLNLAMIAGLWLFHGADEYETARVQAISVTVGGALQLLWLIWACRRAGVSMKLKRPRFDADVRELLRLIVPAAAGAGASQINLLISTALSGWLLASGSITYIYYADRLNQLPLGLIGIGLGTILLPTISRMLSTGQEQQAMETQNRGIELALFPHPARNRRLHHRGRTDRTRAVPIWALHGRRCAAVRLGAVGLFDRPALLCAREGTDARLLCARRYEDAGALCDAVDPHQHHRQYRADPADGARRAGACRAAARDRAVVHRQCGDALCDTGEARAFRG